jgi:hypothetical protein
LTERIEMNILLIHPPVVKPCEPPAGPAILAGSLKARGIGSVSLDANLEGLLWLIDAARGDDVWTRRAVRNRAADLERIKDPGTYRRPARYRRAVSDLNRLAAVAAGKAGVQINLSNYRDERLSPLKSGDLVRAAEGPERNPFYDYFRPRLSELLDTGRFASVGLSLNFLGQALTTFAMIGFLRRLQPDLKIVLGGGLVTSWMSRLDLRRILRGWVDEVIAGPGEEPLLKLSGVEPDSRCYTPSYAGYPWPDYFSPGPILPYSASRGCYWRRCRFCPERAEGSRYCPVPPDRVISELAELQAETDPVLIHFLDNAISPALLEALVRNHSGAPWYGFARIAPQLADPDFCRALKRSGCAMLQFGVESGDQGVLDDLEKGIDLKTASAALKNLKAAGIATYVYLLFGTPAEDEAAARKTLDFTARHGECIDFLNIAVFNLPVGSEETAELQTGSFYEGDLSLYTDFTHPRGWDRKTVRLFLEKEFKQHPAVKAIVLRDPPVFTSNHAAFFGFP